MKKYKVRYSTSGTTTKIDADGPTEAYKLFLKQTGVKPITVVIDGLFSSEFFDDHVVEEKVERDQRESQESKEVGQNKNLSTDELLIKIIENQERNINNQNEQTEALGKIRWAIIGLGFFIVVTTIVLKMKLEL